MLAMVADWLALLDSGLGQDELRDLRDHGRTGCPLGSAAFVEGLEQAAGRVPPPKTGPPGQITQTAKLGSCPRNPNPDSLCSLNSSHVQVPYKARA